jgi:heat shock protein HslJ
MLVLMRDGSTVTQAVTVTVVPAAPDNPLEGTSWTVIGYNNGAGALVSVLADTNLTANFDATQVSGSSGCNEYTGPYWVSGSNIAAGPFAGGMMFCAAPPGIMDQEAQFLAAMQSAVTWSISGNVLELRTASGASAVTMTR